MQRKRLIDVTYGFPAPVINTVRRAVPGMLRALGARPELVERGRRAAGDLYSGLVRKYSFGEPKSSILLVDDNRPTVESAPAQSTRRARANPRSQRHPGLPRRSVSRCRHPVTADSAGRTHCWRWQRSPIWAASSCGGGLD